MIKKYFNLLGSRFLGIALKEHLAILFVPLWGTDFNVRLHGQKNWTRELLLHDVESCTPISIKEWTQPVEFQIQGSVWPALLTYYTENSSARNLYVGKVPL